MLEKKFDSTILMLVRMGLADKERVRSEVFNGEKI